MKPAASAATSWPFPSESLNLHDLSARELRFFRAAYDLRFDISPTAVQYFHPVSKRMALSWNDIKLWP
jgi:hypothetical protein